MHGKPAHDILRMRSMVSLEIGLQCAKEVEPGVYLVFEDLAHDCFRN